MIKSAVKTRVARKNLLLPELIIVIFFFSLAAAACVSLFANAQTDVRKSRDLTEAVILAQNFAEVFKTTGDINETAEILGIPPTEIGNLRIYAEPLEKDDIIEAHIFISRLSDNELIYKLVTAVVKEAGYE